jgi:hypothetical protein
LGVFVAGLVWWGYVPLIPLLLFLVVVQALAVWLAFWGLELVEDSDFIFSLIMLTLVAGFILFLWVVAPPYVSFMASDEVTFAMLGPRIGERLGRLFDPALLPIAYFVLAPVLLLGGLFYLWSHRILPFRPEEREARHTDAFRHLLSFFTEFPRPAIFVEEGKLETRIAGNPFLGTGPGLLVTEPHNAVVLRGGSNIQGIVGPGVIFTGRAQVAHDVIELRKQLHVDKVRAQTRDGIEVNVPISSFFKLRGSQPPVDLGEPWHYHRNAVYLAYFAAEVDPGGKTPLQAHQADSWEELPLQTAKATVRQLVGQYTLDQLYTSHGKQQQQLTRFVLGNRVRRRVEEEMADKGIEIIGGGVGNRIEPVDEEVVVQRIETWKAKWRRRIEENRGKALAESLEQERRVRSEALHELLTNLRDPAEELEDLDGSTERLVLDLQILDALREISLPPPQEEQEGAGEESAASRRLEMQRMMLLEEAQRPRWRDETEEEEE